MNKDVQSLTEPVNERGPKFRRRPAARPDEVLDAALALFMEKGFAATRVEDIAKRAGISKGAVYLYFSSKNALLEGLVQRGIAPVATNALGQLAHLDGDPLIIIETVMRGMSRQLADPKLLAIPKLVMREAVVAPEIAEMYRRAVLDKAIPALTGLVARGVKEGYVRPVDPELTVRSVIGPLLLHVLLAEVFAITPKGGFRLDDLIENHLTILINGLRPEGSSAGSADK